MAGTLIAYRGLIIRGAFLRVRMKIALFCSVLYCFVCPMLVSAFVGVKWRVLLWFSEPAKHTRLLSRARTSRGERESERERQSKSDSWHCRGVSVVSMSGSLYVCTCLLMLFWHDGVLLFIFVRHKMFRRTHGILHKVPARTGSALKKKEEKKKKSCGAAHAQLFRDYPQEVTD